MRTKIKNILLKIPLFNILVKQYISSRIKYKNRFYNYDFLSSYLSKKDRESIKDSKELKLLHEKLDKHRTDQISSWNSFVYCNGYYYQGYLKIGINGIKPTEPRMKKYDISTYFNIEKNVLDIGSNSGFITSYLSDYYNKVTGIELNPYLIKMSEEVKTFIKKKNIDFIEGNFIEYEFKEKFDSVFSLSNHFTIDGNLNIGFEQYVYKIYNLTNTGAFLFFESHDINGDDKDLEEKFKIASKYFELIEYKMVKAEYPADLDKLFAIFSRKNEISEVTPSDFSLENAKLHYEFVKAK